MKITSTTIPNCMLIQPEIFYDYRGEYVNTFSKSEFESTFNMKFVEDDVSISRRNVFRGFHGDSKTWKLVQCLYGEIILGVVDYRVKLRTLPCQTIYLNEKNRTQVLIPPGCANGHYVISDKAIFSYKQSEEYTDGENQFTIKYNDERIYFPWINNTFKPITSERDR